uniref:tape measure protein n=1 Tax=Brucella pseudintermedia TaxID=370111 RepID=UPI00158ADF98|nr:tape measure protein [Brucella pseudintermedia]
MATTDLERLVVQFSADFKRLENETKRSTAMFNRQLRQMERQATSSVKRINTAFSGVGRLGGAAKGLIAGISAATVKTYLDSAVRIDNALKVAGLSGRELDDVYQDLYKTATKNAVPLETLVTLYGRISLVQKELGASTQDVKAFTDSIAMALRVAGTNPEAASGALLQLSQALGSGVVRAEEFNSLMEGGLPILQAAAAGIKEAGGSVNTLRQLMLNGELSSKAFFRGIEAGTPILEERLSGAVLTIDQRLTNLQTSLIDAAKRFNQSAQASETFGSGIDALANSIDNLDISALVADINAIISKFAQGEAAARNFAAGIGEALGLDNVGKFLTGGQAQASYFGGALTITSSKVIRDRINSAHEGVTQAFDNEVTEALKKKYGGKEARLPKVKEAVNSPKFDPISLADYAVPAAEKKGRGASSGRSGRERINEYERELRSINERTVATVAETEALRQLNPLVDDYGYAVEKARTEQDLMNAAQRAGLAITPELRAQIAATADQWAMATAEANKLAEAQDKIRQRSEEWQDAQKDALRGIVDDLIQGKSAAEAFAGALQKIANKLLDMAFDDLFTGLFKGSGGGGGFLSGLIPGFAKGTNSAPRGLAVVGENGPELVRFNGGEQVIPNHKLNAPTLPNLRGAASSGGGGSFTFAPVIDARGADVAAVARLEQVVAKQQAEFSARVVQTMRQAKSTRNWRGN